MSSVRSYEELVRGIRLGVSHQAVGGLVGTYFLEAHASFGDSLRYGEENGEVRELRTRSLMLVLFF